MYDRVGELEALLKAADKKLQIKIFKYKYI